MEVRSERLEAAQKVIEATPSLEAQVAEFGEEKFKENPDGTYRIDLTDSHGRVDMRKVHTAKEMFKDRSRAEVRLAETKDKPVDYASMGEKQRWDRWIAEGRKRR